MNEPILTLGAFHLTGFGIGCALGLFAAFCVALKYSWRQGMRYAQLAVYALLALPLGWLCSRLLFVAANYRYYSMTLGSFAPALYFWDGGYSLMGMLLGAMLAALPAAKLTQVPAGHFLDALGFAAAPAVMCVRLFERGTGLGDIREIMTEYIAWPIWQLESIAAIIIFIVLAVYLQRVNWRPAHRGDVLCLFLLLFGSNQVILESLHGDGHMEVHFVRIQQVIALLLACAVLGVWTARLLKSGGSRRVAIIGSAIALVCVGAGIAAEFAVDRSAEKLLAYAVMGICMIGICTIALTIRRLANRVTDN